MKPIITRGADFSLTFQITTEPYAEGLLIQGSSTANPCVVTMQLPHELATNGRVRISGHRKNTIINGKQTVTVITPFTFSVPVAGVITGEVSGRVSKAVDISGFAVSAKTKSNHGGSEITNAVPTLAVLVAADGECSISLTKLQTPNIIPNSCILEITYVDGSNFTRIFGIECEVKSA